jgi:hypothetical protein
MRGTLLSVILMIIAAVMMGCTDSIVPCTEDIDCQWDWGWEGDSDRGADWGGDYGLYCNLEVSPLEECEEIMSYVGWILEWVDWIPIGDWILLPDCTELYGGLPEGTGTCDISWGWF